MRLIIGIVLGILIAFNWSSIKNMFDSSLAEQATSAEKPNPALPAQVQPQPIVQQQMPQSLSGAVEQRLKDAAANRN
jgi:hypothetical protein